MATMLFSLLSCLVILVLFGSGNGRQLRRSDVDEDILRAINDEVRRNVERDDGSGGLMRRLAYRTGPGRRSQSERDDGSGSLLRRVAFRTGPERRDQVDGDDGSGGLMRRVAFQTGAADRLEKRWQKRAPTSCAPKYANAPAPSTMCEYEDAPGIKDLGVSTSDRQGILDLHNQLRSQVKPPSTNMQKMYWDEEIAVIAQKWAQTCVPAHDEGFNRRVPNYHIGIGQNWAGGFNSWEESIVAWHAEVKDFTFSGTNHLELVGHYTQVVAAAAGAVGCGYAYCPNNVNPQNYVCNYAFGQSDINLPYSNGRSCADCPGSCVDGLCDCRGRVCKNGGTLDVGTCTCQCGDVADGAECENLKCPSVEGEHCGTAPYDKTACTKYATFPSMCPIMCEVCEDRCPGMTADYCENEGIVNAECNCDCKEGFKGVNCEKFATCKEDEDYCGQPYPQGYPVEYCTKYGNIPQECPHMCGKC